MEEFNKLINGSKPVLVDFFATWCGPCRMQSPILDKVKSTVGDEADVLKINVDQNKALAAKYTIKSVPTLIIFKNGEPVWRASGLHHADDLVSKLRENL